MKSSIIKSVIALMTISVLLFAYANCSEYKAQNLGALDLDSNSDRDQDDIGTKAMQILNTQCASCHGPNNGTVGGFANISDLPGLITQGQIVPNDAEASILFQSLTGANGIMLMPPGSAISLADIQFIESWINAGAPAPQENSDVGSTLPLAANYASIDQNILKPKCLQCHNATRADGGVRYDTHAETLKSIDLVNPAQSDLYTEVLTGKMPQAPLPPLSNQEVSVILEWITAGALNN